MRNLRILGKSPYAPKGDEFGKLLVFEKLISDDGVAYDKVVVLTAEDILLKWPHESRMAADIHGQVPDPQKIEDTNERRAIERAFLHGSET